MSELQNLIDQANECYEKGMAFKDVAITGDEHLTKFLKAEKEYLKAADYVCQAVAMDADNFNFKILSIALQEY